MDVCATPLGRDEDEVWSSEDAASSAAKPVKKQEENMIKVKRSHTNALVLSLGGLGASQDHLVASGPTFCSECGAAVSMLSRLTTNDGQTSWDW